MKQIPLTQGKVALVDDEDYDFLMQWKWTLASSKGKEYAHRRKKIGDLYYTFKMHRVILEIANSETKADHKDGNGLNNQRSNLRIATQQENCFNRKSRIDKPSLFKGVSIERKKNGPRWLSTISINKKQTKLGRTPHTPCGELLAAVRYDIAAVKNYGEFANLNFK